MRIVVFDHAKANTAGTSARKDSQRATLDKSITIGERLERIEHISAGLAEERGRNRETDRALWRDTQRQLDQLASRVDAIATHLDTFIVEAAARDRETDRGFRETDARIERMIFSMGNYIRERPPTA